MKFSSKTTLFFNLIATFTRASIKHRLDQTLFGYLWLLIYPFLLMIFYTFIFGFIFQSKLGAKGDIFAFALNIYIGIIFLEAFNEIISRSCSLIIDNRNILKKISFPISVIPISICVELILTLLISVAVFSSVFLIFHDKLYFNLFSFLIIISNYFLVLTSLSFLISIVSVYVKDFSQITRFINLLAMFTAPIFYNLEDISGNFKFLIYLNPVTLPLTSFKSSILLNQTFNYFYHILLFFFLLTFTYACSRLFILSRKYFVDEI